MPKCLEEDEIGPAKVKWDVDPALTAKMYTRFAPREELFTMKASG